MNSGDFTMSPACTSCSGQSAGIGIVDIDGVRQRLENLSVRGAAVEFIPDDAPPVTARVRERADACVVRLDGRTTVLSRAEPARRSRAMSGAEGRLTAPMPGTVSAVLVREGQAVRAGETLLVVEAMKMEHAIHAPHAGVVESIRVEVGQKVGDGAELVSLTEAPPERG